MWRTADEFLNERHDMLEVRVVPDRFGDGFDVVLRVDGTYSSKSDAEEAALSIREALVRILGREVWFRDQIGADEVREP